jgi:putative aldouronate transport system substrate-binding protein
LKKFLDEKVVDPDWFLNKSGQQTEKAQQGKAGIIYSTGREFAFDNHPSSIQKKTKEITGNANVDWQPFHPWASTGVFSEALPGNPFMFGSKTPDNKIKRSIEILDWLCGPEGYLLTHFGQEGTHYKKTGNTIDLIPDAFKRDVTDNGNFLSIYGAFTPIYDFAKLGFVIKDPQETDRDRSILEKLKSYKYIPSIGTNVAVPTGMNLSDFRKQMNQYQTKILFEEKDASNWPKYRQELMSKYGGKPIFEAYAEQIGAAHGKKYVFKTEN